MSDRYSRQTLFPDIGNKGQKILGQSQVVVAGCGALGTIIATSLVRAGLGNVKIIDREGLFARNLTTGITYGGRSTVN
jgi:adenylyltransferase/sulfurtransferase